MRILLLLPITAAACGDVHSETAPGATDASSIDTRADSPPSPPPDAPSGNPGPCPMHIANAALPVWFGNNGFTLDKDPAGSGAAAWRSNGHLVYATSFVVPYEDGDTITGLTIEAYGTGGGGGLQNVQVIYRPDPASFKILGQVDDNGRKAEWGQINFPGFQPTTLSAAGIIEVSFTVTELGYYLGRVTPTIERPCNK